LPLIIIIFARLSVEDLSLSILEETTLTLTLFPFSSSCGGLLFLLILSLLLLLLLLLPPLLFLSPLPLLLLLSSDDMHSQQPVSQPAS